MRSEFSLTPQFRVVSSQKWYVFLLSPNIPFVCFYFFFQLYLLLHLLYVLVNSYIRSLLHVKLYLIFLIFFSMRFIISPQSRSAEYQLTLLFLFSFPNLNYKYSVLHQYLCSQSTISLPTISPLFWL